MNALMEIISDHVQNSNFTAVFLDAALKSFVVLALAGGLCLCWRRASAATRHLIWFLAVVSLPCLPLLSSMLPSWHKPLWSVSTGFGSGNEVSLTLELAPTAKAGFAPGPESTPATGSELSHGVGGVSGGTHRVATHFSRSWLVLASVAWLAGILLNLISIAVARWRVHQISQAARPFADVDWAILLREACEKLDVHRTVILLQSMGDVMPVTWGWWRPVVLLPAEAEQWSEDRKRVVLLHELAHVKRWDCLTQMITAVVCALYWFNPLVWLAARRMCVERERACDDLVLNGGCQPSDYASHLVEIARTFRRVPQVAAIAMARRSGLGRRVTAILDVRRNRKRIAKIAAVFIALAFLGLEFLTGANAMKNSPKPWSLDRSIVSDQLKHFAAEKVALARAAARADGKGMPPEFKSFFAAAEKGNWPAMSNIFEDLRGPALRNEGSATKACFLHPIEWSTTLEIFGAFEEFAAGDEKYSVAFGREVIASIPPGSIYFGGTDPGRFVISALCKSHANADPFFALTPMLADNGYLQNLRGMYGTRIYVPTPDDLTNAFNQYVDDARRRQKENKLIPGEDLKEVDGKMQVNGFVSVRAIHGLLTKLTFDKNPDREFYIDENFPFDWMYAHLSPHGLIMKINRRELAELSEEVVQRDHEYWTRYVQPMIGGWLNYETPVREIAAFIEKVFANHDLSGFNGDPRFVQNDRAQKTFSQPRASIGGLYNWRFQYAANPGEKQRMMKEADFAFRQSFALCPSSPVSVFRYVNLLVERNRLEDAVLVTEAAMKVDPQNTQFEEMAKELKRFKAQQKN